MNKINAISISYWNNQNSQENSSKSATSRNNMQSKIKTKQPHYQSNNGVSKYHRDNQQNTGRQPFRQLILLDLIKELRCIDTLADRFKPYGKIFGIQVLRPSDFDQQLSFDAKRYLGENLVHTTRMCHGAIIEFETARTAKFCCGVLRKRVCEQGFRVAVLKPGAETELLTQRSLIKRNRELETTSVMAEHGSCVGTSSYATSSSSRSNSTSSSHASDTRASTITQVSTCSSRSIVQEPVPTGQINCMAVINQRKQRFNAMNENFSQTRPPQLPDSQVSQIHRPNQRLAPGYGRPHKSQDSARSSASDNYFDVSLEQQFGNMNLNNQVNYRNTYDPFSYRNQFIPDYQASVMPETDNNISSSRQPRDYNMMFFPQ